MEILYHHSKDYSYSYYEDEHGRVIYHALDDEPCWVWTNGTLQWFKHNKCHRDNGPAFIKRNFKMWYYNDIFLGNSQEGYNDEKFEQFKRLAVFI